MISLKKTAVALAAAALVLAGCSAANSGDKKTDGADKVVTILTHDSFKISEEDIKAFQEESGYQLKTVSAGDGTVLNQLLINKDKPVVDGFYGVDTFQAAEVINSGLAEEFVPKGLEKSDTVDGKLAPIDRGDVCLNADNRWFADKNIDIPKSFDDLLKPEYKNLTVLTDPLQSTPGMAFLAATVSTYGDKWTDYWKDLLANGTKVVKDWSTAYYTEFSGSEGKGAYPIVLSYSSSPAYEKGATSSLNDTCIKQIEYAGVTKGAKNADGAKAFIEFLLTDKVQKSIPENMYVYPYKKNIELPKEWATYAPLPTTVIEADIKKVGAERKAWLDEYSKIYQESTK